MDKSDTFWPIKSVKHDYIFNIWIKRKNVGKNIITFQKEHFHFINIGLIIFKNLYIYQYKFLSSKCGLKLSIKTRKYQVLISTFN